MYEVTTIDFITMVLLGAIVFGAGVYASTFFYEQEEKEVVQHIVTSTEIEKKKIDIEEDDDTRNFYQ